jgi:hypothetical protein
MSDHPIPTSPVNRWRGRQDADPASINVLAKKFWQDAGGAMLTEQDLLRLPDAARDPVVALMTQRHGHRREKRRR